MSSKPEAFEQGLKPAVLKQSLQRTQREGICGSSWLTNGQEWPKQRQCGAAPPDREVRRTMKKRSIVIAGHKTSVSLEDAFWKGLKEIAAGRDVTLSDLVGAIDSERVHGNLSSVIRLFVLEYYCNQRTTAEPGVT